MVALDENPRLQKRVGEPAKVARLVAGESDAGLIEHLDLAPLFGCATGRGAKVTPHDVSSAAAIWALRARLPIGNAALEALAAVEASALYQVVGHNGFRSVDALEDA